MFPAGVPGVSSRRVVLSGGLGIRITESGDPGAPPVLLVHGWGASAYMWRGWFAPLARSGHRVVAIDLPGHGMSDKPDEPRRYTVDAMSAVLREVIALEGLRRPHVVAQSMGGSITLATAESDEVALGKVALINPALFGRVRILALARFISPPAVAPLLDRFVPRWVVARAHRLVYGEPSGITPEDIDQYWAASQFPGYARAMRHLVHQFTWARPPAEQMAARLREVAKRVGPPLVVLGTLDRLVREARPYAAALVRAGAPIEMYESVGGGHAVNEERPDEIVPVVERHFGAA